MTGRTLRKRKTLTPPPPVSERTTRPRRTVTNPVPPTTIERSSPDESRTTSIRLTVKADPKKLQKATGGKPIGNPRDSLDVGAILKGPRITRKKAIIVESESEEEDDEDAEGEDEDLPDDEDEDEDEDDEDDEEDEEDAEGEDDDEDEDENMEDATPIPPKGMLKVGTAKQITTAPPQKELPSVEDKEMAMDEDDEELSELDDEDGMEMAEGLGAEGEEGEGLDSDDDMSRSGTPDPKAQKKKHFTAEEIDLRRAEMARRRKNLSEKRNEEEKMDTINRLLKKQAPKRQRKADVEADRIAEEGEAEPERPSKVYVRYVQTTRGSVLGVPIEWVENRYVGGLFSRDAVKSKSSEKWTGRMVEVIE